MAHIQVVRRSMRPEEWTRLRFGWLKRHIYKKKYEIKTLQIREARQISEMEFEYYSDDYAPLCKGDMYFTPTARRLFEGTLLSPTIIAVKNFG